MEKYIFLDIDGVIAIPSKLDNSGCWELDDEKQEFLGQIISRTGAKIVLSSSWRRHNVEETKIKMKEEGFWFCDEIVGVTIRGYHYIDRSSKIHLSIPRGVEIKQYIDVHLKFPWIGNPELKEKYSLVEDGIFKQMISLKLGIDYQYVILDDDSDMLLEHREYFVHTKSRIGLTQQDVDKAISILNC